MGDWPYLLTAGAVGGVFGWLLKAWQQRNTPSARFQRSVERLDRWKRTGR